MNILFVSSEVEPFSKTGGLADVSAALPKALERLGHKFILSHPNIRQWMKRNLIWLPQGSILRCLYQIRRPAVKYFRQALEII